MTDVYEFERLYQPHGWSSPGFLEVDGGKIVSAGAAPPAGTAVRVGGYAIPSMRNAHSHAFQRVLAGSTEWLGGGDGFWSWRNGMYRLVSRIEPDDLQVIATQVFVEMLEAGYTRVGEFHYLHRDPQGQAYSDPTELCERVVRAARTTGIGLTLLPVLYTAGGFGGVPLSGAQGRFMCSVDELIEVFTTLVARHRDEPEIAFGIAPHSLRAVQPDTLAECVAALARVSADAVVHIHAAEQLREVEECVAWSGLRPVEWLLRNQELGPRWCVVHATHVTEVELRELAKTGAAVAVCPTTEANLGDGFFPLRRYLDAGGRLAIGSDSNVSVSPIEELRWLEYGQRLCELRRNVVADASSNSSGATLWNLTSNGGARALGQKSADLESGARADLIVLDPEHPALLGRPADRLLDALVFAATTTAVKDVMVGGRWVVRDGRHVLRDAVRAQFTRVVERLFSA